MKGRKGLRIGKEIEGIQVCGFEGVRGILVVRAMGSPDMFMIEAAPGAKDIELAKWRSGPLDESVDALPYIDHDYTDAKLKAEVDQLVAEEMRASFKKPADFLAELPVVPSINSQVWFIGCCLLSTFVGAISKWGLVEKRDGVFVALLSSVVIGFCIRGL